MNTILRPAFGQRSSLGALYDARRDVFLTENILKNDIPDEAITVTSIGESQTKFITSDSFKEKLANLDVNDELIASFLTGMINPEGSARYLTQRRNTLPNVHRARVNTWTMLHEGLNFSHPDVRSFLDFAAPQGGATHLVTGVTWGSRTIVSATYQFVDESTRTGYESALDAVFQKANGNANMELENPFADDAQINNMNGGLHDLPQVRVFSDLADPNFDPPENLEEALTYTRMLMKSVEGDGLSKGRPLTYTLLPLDSLAILGATIAADSLAGQLSKECLEKYLNLVDGLFSAGQNLNAYYQSLRSARFNVKSGRLNEVADKLRAVQNLEADLKNRCAIAVENVRASPLGSQQIWQILEEVSNGPLGPSELLKETLKNRKKLDFTSAAVMDGAELILDAGMPLREAMSRRAGGEGSTYIFYFNDAVMVEAQEGRNSVWDDNEALLMDLLTSERPRGSPVFIVDCDAAGMQLDECRVEAYFNEALISKDVLKQRKVLADKHILRYDRRVLQHTNEIPSRRRMFKIPCPGYDCDNSEGCQWVCGKCHTNVEYGLDDGFCYCDCGRFPSEASEFNCQRQHHGSSFVTYPHRAMKDVVRNLPPPREVNILILGETGVGKSTFINAFVNYLTFPSLEEALSAGKLNYVIPCSFTTQRHDDQDKLVSTKVTIGKDKDEKDGSKGQSATQQTSVYPLYIGDMLIRLIDTPGIGDTRGLEQDAENLINVLSVLRNYPDLHGILILLKPNNARLGVMFKFCVKELLTQLHRSAAANMVFGFTNTRGSNYTPGDTFTPLEVLLSKYKDAIPGLFRSNVYCFDSESFRYLAAQKQAGIDLGNTEDYRRSWTQSAEEAERLLQHFQTLRPHHTQQTLSLNETRHLISQLVTPMQQISTAISDTIANSEKQARELSEMHLTGKDLEKRLNIQKVIVNANHLSQPKTVCSNEACVQTVLNEADGQQVTLRKHLRHNPCCLKNVPVCKVGTPELQSCYAFNGPTCKECEHHWSEHEHIIVEYSMTSQTVTDPEVKRELEQNGNVTKAKEAAVQALQRQISELKAEHLQVQEAAAKFSIYLKSNSITHYNDATKEYLEHLIRDERTKVGAGAPRTALERLEKNLTNYKQFVETMVEGMKKCDPHCKVLDEASVAQLVQKLYNLPHYGQQLKNMANIVQNAYAATFNEKPYRIRGRSYWMGTDIGSSGGLGSTGFGDDGGGSYSSTRPNFYSSGSFASETSKFKWKSSKKQNRVERGSLDMGGDTHLSSLSQSHSTSVVHNRSRSVFQVINPFRIRTRSASIPHDGGASDGVGGGDPRGFGGSAKSKTLVAQPAAPPTKSICDWGDDAPDSSVTSTLKKNRFFKTNTIEEENDGGSMNGPLPPGPPRYDELSFQNANGNTAPEIEFEIVEKKGAWEKFRTKLRKN